MTNKSNQTWQVQVQQDHDGELVLPLPQEVLDRVGWRPGDQLTWHDRGDGTWELRLKQELLDSGGC